MPRPHRKVVIEDTESRLKRQAARFRVYGYDNLGNVVGELTSINAEIQRSVHVASKKAAWYDFDVALDLPESINVRSARRNSAIQGQERRGLIIDPGPRSISGDNQRSTPFDSGEFLGKKVYFGELLTDEGGRLNFLGGKVKSESPLPGYSLVTFANSPGWHDDTSDGPVSATVTLNGRSIPVDPAWVVTAPPNYSPDLVMPQTMYDVIRDTLAGSLLPRPVKPSFTQDILPLLSQFNETQWVNKGFLVQFGWSAPNDFLRPDVLAKLATPPKGNNGDPFGE